MSGATEAGDDMVVGRRNESDDSTSLIAISSSDGYGDDYVLNVATSLLTTHGIDAIHAEGWPQPGNDQTGNGIVSTGSNGVVGYVRAVARDTDLEESAGAGLLGVGGGASPGVFGSGHNGVVGYEQAMPRDVAFESVQRAGVLGRGDTGVVGRGETGVRGVGDNGAGVLGSAVGNPGVHGVSRGGPGLLGNGDEGVIAQGKIGPGLIADSKLEQAAVLQSVTVAQLLLVPLRIPNPASLSRSVPGELLATVWPNSAERDAIDVASLWFCTDARPEVPANWVKLA